MTMCSRCNKNVAVVFITKLENGQQINEGLCIKCAKELNIPMMDKIMPNRCGHGRRTDRSPWCAGPPSPRRRWDPAPRPDGRQ